MVALLVSPPWGLGNLREHAQRTGHRRRASVGGDDRFWRHAVLDPVYERCKGVEHVRPWPAQAVVHPRNHEQASVLLRFTRVVVAVRLETHLLEAVILTVVAH